MSSSLSPVGPLGAKLGARLAIATAKLSIGPGARCDRATRIHGVMAISGAAGRFKAEAESAAGFPGQNQINARSRTLAPKPTTCAVPKLPLVQAIQATMATIASTTITHAKRILLPDMALEFGFGFAGVWICCAYLLVSELPYIVSQLPSKAVSVLM